MEGEDMAGSDASTKAKSPPQSGPLPHVGNKQSQNVEVQTLQQPPLPRRSLQPKGQSSTRGGRQGSPRSLAPGHGPLGGWAVV